MPISLSVLPSTTKFYKVLRYCLPIFRSNSTQVGGQIRHPSVRSRISAPSGADIDTLYEQLDNARLFGGKQCAPERIEPLQRLAHLGFRDWAN